MKKTLLILTTLFLVSFQKNEFNNLKKVIGKTTYPFWLSVPENEEKMPVLVFLHGKSLSGTNLERVKRYGVLTEMKKGRNFNAIVVAPQTSNTWNPDEVLEVLEYVQKNYNTDAKRVYVCGMSMGGNGTLRFAGKYPDRLTAAVAICANENVKDGCNMAKVPLWIQHGDQDIPVPVSESRKTYQSIIKCDPKADATLTIIKGGTHSSVENLFHRDDIYEWMFKYVKD